MSTELTGRMLFAVQKTPISGDKASRTWSPISLSAPSLRKTKGPRLVFTSYNYSTTLKEYVLCPLGARNELMAAPSTFSLAKVRRWWCLWLWQIALSYMRKTADKRQLTGWIKGSSRIGSIIGRKAASFTCCPRGPLSPIGWIRAKFGRVGKLIDWLVIN
jgi:hypothetical protein